MSTPEEDLRQTITREVREELLRTIRQEEDIKQLDLLATFHYILRGFIGFFSCFPLIHVAMGVFMLIAVSPLGIIFVIMGLLFAGMGWTLAICIFIAARNLNRKANYKFCFVIACVECVLVPLGTILGIFTITALSKDSVKAAFLKEPPSNG
jgi:hypothetical protein